MNSLLTGVTSRQVNDQRTVVVLALWAAACGWLVAISVEREPYSVVLFVLLSLATIVFAAVARRPIAVVAPIAMSIPLGVWAATAACPCDGIAAWQVVLVWIGVFGLAGALLAAVTLMVARRALPGVYHPPFRLDRAR